MPSLVFYGDISSLYFVPCNSSDEPTSFLVRNWNRSYQTTAIVSLLNAIRHVSSGYFVPWAFAAKFGIGPYACIVLLYILRQYVSTGCLSIMTDILIPLLFISRTIVQYMFIGEATINSLPLILRFLSLHQQHFLEWYPRYFDIHLPLHWLFLFVSID